MKDGCQGQTPTINNIEGIVVPLPGGRQFKMIPKYLESCLLHRDKIDELKLKCYNEAEAIFNEDNKSETDEYLRLGSPAAEHVRSFGCDLPTFEMAAAIIKFRPEINKVAEQIEGADILEIGSLVWTSCRSNPSSAWIDSGFNGNANSYYFYGGNLAVPVAL